MTITVTCECGKVCQFRPDAAGKRIRCPDCDGVISVPNRRPRRNDERRPADRRPQRRPSREDDEPRKKGSPADRAIARVSLEMGTYRHKGCGARTHVPDEYLELMALDPWLFRLGSTECDGCGDARCSDAILDDGRTLRDAMTELRQSVPAAGFMMRFVVIPLLAAMLGALAGAILGMATGGKHNVLMTVFGLGMGGIGGTYANKWIFKELRRIGAFW